MNVERVRLTNFTRHDDTSLVLPKTGILLITGENGEGKSSFLEGVSWAAWGKTLRGTAPWRDDAKPPCTAYVSTDHMNITRKRDGKKTEVEWEDYVASQYDAPGATSDDPEYDSPTKAQAALVTVVGSFDLWRRSHVFSSTDEANFTTSTDKERKQLIESFLGNDRFDPALEACRIDLKKVRDHHTSLSRQKDVTHTALTAATRAVETAERNLAELGLPTLPSESPAEMQPLEPLDALLSKKRRGLNEVRADMSKIDSTLGEAKGRVRQLAELLARVKKDICPTCTQQISAEHRKTIIAKHDEAKAEVDEGVASIADMKRDAEEAVKELEADIAKHQAERDRRQRAHDTAKVLAQSQARYDAQKASMEKTLAFARKDRKLQTSMLVGYEEEIDLCVAELEVLESVEHVLGIKGVRAHILGKSLHGVEAVANAWLARLHPTARIVLKPYSEFKSKEGVDDSISFEVEGLRHGLGYAATSGGERRRLDVAMLFAMAEVANAARGKEAGTLWFDEVFDRLDEAGVEAVCDVLRELAQDRCIVVITHSKTLIERLPDATKVRVVAGRIET